MKPYLTAGAFGHGAFLLLVSMIAAGVTSALYDGSWAGAVLLVLIWALFCGSDVVAFNRLMHRLTRTELQLKRAEEARR